MSGQSIGKKFEQRFGMKPMLFRAPGRINLIGEHTDYNDGFVMPAAIDREIVFALAPAADARTIIYADDLGESMEVDLGEIRRLGKTLEELEKEIEEKEAAIRRAEEELANEAIYEDPEKLADANRTYAGLRQALTELNQQWDRLAERITELESQ